MNKISKSVTLPDGRVITIETGRLARQADGSVWLTCGQTAILATVVANREVKLDLDFLPLTVDYIEKFSAAGRFPGGFFKRDGRLGEGEILTSRLVDRALRPLFPDDYHADTQVMIQLYSTDSEEQPDALACLAASSALMVSELPFPDPVTEVRVIRKDGKFHVNPGLSMMEGNDLDLMVACTPDSVIMVEGEMREVSEETMLEALRVAFDTCTTLNKLQMELREAVGKSKWEYPRLEFNEAMYNELDGMIAGGLNEMAHSASAKEERSATLKALKTNAHEVLAAKFAETDPYFETHFKEYFKSIQKRVVRDMAVKENRRLDGRRQDEIRTIWSEAGLLLHAHGSSLFTRGETQSLCTVTLGTKLDEQTIDTTTFRGSKKFYLHYTFPGFSTGEVRPNRAPGRREVGHGNLAERALKPMIPAEYPYTVRVESSILESNGSSSMASVCGGCLALMDAGVQILRPVSGIAMGLITTKDGYAVLSDILGDEDFLGDMDFKVAGSVNGLTACQMDIKIRGLSFDIIEAALQQSKAGRMHILDRMLETLSEPRQDLSPYAPRFEILEVPIEFFGQVIGPGGKVIQEIQRQTGTTIVLEEVDSKMGTATISSPNLEGIEKAVRQIKSIIQLPDVGDVFMAKVKSVMAYGAFVEFLPGKEGLLHISEISYDRLETMDGVLEVGDDIEIKLVGIDPRSGKFRLSRKALLPEPEGGAPRGDRPPRDDRPRDDRPRGDRPPRRDDRPRDDRPRGDRPPRRD